MHAAIHRRYGPADVLTIEQAARPEPGDGEILVKVAAAGVTSADWRIRASDFPAWSWVIGRMMFGLFRPRHRIPGSDFAGRVVARGRNVTAFRLGDAVFGVAGRGAHAEYLTIRGDAAVAPMPAALGFDQAAALPFGALAAQGFLRDFARVRPGERVLIAGATGGVGAYAVQIARAMGADVTALASAEKCDLALRLGAHRAIDYRAGDFSRGTDRFDVVLDTAGVTGWRQARRVLVPGGRFVPLEFGLADLFRALTGRLRRARTVIGISGDSAEDLHAVADMVRAGTLAPVIDSRYPLHRIAGAHRRVEGRHKTGAVVLTLDGAMPRAEAA